MNFKNPELNISICLMKKVFHLPTALFEFTTRFFLIAMFPQMTESPLREQLVYKTLADKIMAQQR